MAVGDRVETRLVGPSQLTATDAGLGGAVVPSSSAWIIKQVILCNTSGIDRLVYLGIGGAATGGVTSRFINALPVAAYDTVVLDTALILNATERLWGYSDLASAVNIIVVGWVKEL
jgi:hypothetical protein